VRLHKVNHKVNHFPFLRSVLFFAHDLLVSNFRSVRCCVDMAVGLEHEVNAGIMSTSVTRMPYCMCYVRHIDGIEYHLNEELAPKFVDVIEHNNIRTIDRAKNRRLQELKVVC